jgi:hypothetical protein
MLSNRHNRRLQQRRVGVSGFRGRARTRTHGVKQETRLELVIEHLKGELKQVKLKIALLEESAQSAEPC